MKKLFQSGLAFLLALSLLLPATGGSAATNAIKVTPASTDWGFVDDNSVAGWTTGFENGPGTPPLGVGSAFIELTSAGAGITLATAKYQGTLLSSITALSYSTYTNLSPAAMSFQINYDPDVTTVEASTWYGRLVYEPYVNGTVTNGTWQTWDTINGGNGKWWASGNANSTVDEACPQSAPCTLTALIAAFPNIGIRNDALSGIQFKAGSNWNGFAGNVDNLSIEIGDNTDIYDFEPLTVAYVDDDWSAVAPNTDPDGSGPALRYGVDSFDTIQAGLNAVVANGSVHVAAGTYTEDLTISKAVNLLGPNDDVNPNSGTRVAEAIIHPATSNPNPNVVCTVMAYLSTSDITIKGFTFDGDNPGLTSGVIINGADVNACEILAGYEGMGNIVVENNILKRSTYSGIDFYNYTNTAATAGNYIRYNLFEDIGETTYNSGIGILVYNNFYADITDNVLNRVRVGIQTGNFEKANPGTTGRIGNNVINAWRLGIFHNMWYSNASVISVDHNTINAVTYPGATKWNGMLLSTFQGTTNTIVADNVINIPATVSFPAPGYTAGYNVWNTTTTAPLTISGGTVTGGDYGVFVNNYEGYVSDATSTSIILDGLTLQDAIIAGVYVKDSPDNTNGATTQATIINSPISNSAVGILVEGADASATGSCNQISGNTAGVNNTTSALLNFEKNWWGAATGPSGAGPGTGDSVSTNVDYAPWSIDTTCNLPPVITEGPSVNVTMSENGSPTPFSLTLNATDPDAGDTLTWSISTQAAHGTASAAGTGLSKVIGYTPVLNYNGTDSFVVQVSDGIATDTITVHVTIDAVGAPTATFLDVPVDHWAWVYVESIYGAGITAGCGNNNYCPGTPVTRDQMAVFLLRGIHGRSYTPPPMTGTVFADIPMGYWAGAWIEQLAAEGITAGCGNNNYCPISPVTRDQMAVFLQRTFNLPLP